MKIPKLTDNGDGRSCARYPRSGGRREWFDGRADDPNTIKAYQAWLSGVMGAMAAGEPILPENRRPRTLTELGEDYLVWAEGYYLLRNRRGEINNVKDTMGLLLSHCGGMAGEDFGPNALRAFRGHLIASGRFARKTIGAHVRRVVRFVKWCQSREMLPRGTYQDLKTVEPLMKGKSAARETQDVQPVDDVVWKATLPFLSPVVADMVQVQYWCGMRPGEVCAMTAEHIEFRPVVWYYRPAEHKTDYLDENLCKGVPPQAQAILAPRLGGPAGRPIFLNSRRRPWNTNAYGEAIRIGALKAMNAGVPIVHWASNQLRHAILTKIRDEHGTEDAQHWAGHKSPNTTRTYTKRTEGFITKVGTQLGRSEKTTSLDSIPR